MCENVEIVQVLPVDEPTELCMHNLCTAVLACLACSEYIVLNKQPPQLAVTCYVQFHIADAVLLHGLNVS